MLWGLIEWRWSDVVVSMSFRDGWLVGDALGNDGTSEWHQRSLINDQEWLSNEEPEGSIKGLTSDGKSYYGFNWGQRCRLRSSNWHQFNGARQVQEDTGGVKVVREGLLRWRRWGQICDNEIGNVVGGEALKSDGGGPYNFCQSNNWWIVDIRGQLGSRKSTMIMGKLETWWFQLRLLVWSTSRDSFSEVGDGAELMD